MITSIASSSLLGTFGLPTAVEVAVDKGLPSFNIVGMSDTNAREVRDRVRAAFMNSSLAWPSARVSVNLASSDGLGSSAMDLAIAVGVYLAANPDKLHPDADVINTAFIGELGLDGTIRPVRGALAMAQALPHQRIVTGQADGTDIATNFESDQTQVFDFEHLSDVIKALTGKTPWPSATQPVGYYQFPAVERTTNDLDDWVLWALTVAVAGHHHVLIKSHDLDKAGRIAGLVGQMMNELSLTEAKELNIIYSARGQTTRFVEGSAVPVRTPDHDASLVSVIGGSSSSIQPGELSLAHHGVLVLEDVAEYATYTLDAIGHNIDSASIEISRGHRSVSLPSDALVVATAPHCPCDSVTHDDGCRCSPGPLSRFGLRVGTITRFGIPIQIDLDEINGEEITKTFGEMFGALHDLGVIRSRVRAVQSLLHEAGFGYNNNLSDESIEKTIGVMYSANEILTQLLRTGTISTRQRLRILRVARSVACLAGDSTEAIDELHVRAALSLCGHGLKLVS